MSPRHAGCLKHRPMMPLLLDTHLRETAEIFANCAMLTVSVVIGRKETQYQLYDSIHDIRFS